MAHRTLSLLQNYRNIEQLISQRIALFNPPARKCRIALYSHDTVGLGHMRRNLLIAKTLSVCPTRADVLMISGSQQLNTFTPPPGVDYLTLPAVFKNADGEYQSRCFDISLKEIITIREQSIRAAMEAFEPDVLIVDKVPQGLLGELNPTLEFLCKRGRTHLVLGLRDILDEKESVLREWNLWQNAEVIKKCYDVVWVYGDPAVYDIAEEYNLADDVVAKIRYAGYLNRQELSESSSKNGRDSLAAFGLPPGRLALCTVGGGEDGALLAEAFARADLPPEFVRLIVTGPFMPRQAQAHFHKLAESRPGLAVIDFVKEPAALLKRADRVVSMGGYNTICEVLSYRKNALIIPRVKPRLEQLIRAECICKLGLLNMLHPDEVTPQALTEWLTRDLLPLPPLAERIDLNGLARLPQLLQEVLFAKSQPSATIIKGR
jgi:predicted glycosyltransferase